MGVQHVGAPTFSIAGDSTSILSQVVVMETRAADFSKVAETLMSVSTDGWTGWAADRFRERFCVEPERWNEAASGFNTAASALRRYATALSQAQTKAATCKSNYEAGLEQTRQARQEYDADVVRGKREKAAWEASNGPGTYTLTIAPFYDPGQATRRQAVADFSAVITELDQVGQSAADDVRRGCAEAPDKRNWLESGFAFVGGIIFGAWEAVADISELSLNLQYGPLKNLFKLITGDLTLEEFAAKSMMPFGTAQQMWTALCDDPMNFGKQLGKGLLDWDTWADDPARALGHLVPDLLAALFTMGGSAAATRGASALSRVDDIVDGVRAMDRVADGVDAAGDVSLGLKGVDEVGDAAHVSPSHSLYQPTEAQLKPPKSIEDLENAIPQTKSPKSPYNGKFLSEGRFGDQCGIDVVCDPTEVFGRNADGTVRSYNDWRGNPEYADLETGAARWGSNNTGTIDVPERLPLDEYIARHGGALDRIGDPWGSFLVLSKKGRFHRLVKDLLPLHRSMPHITSTSSRENLCRIMCL